MREPNGPAARHSRMIVLRSVLAMILVWALAACATGNEADNARDGDETGGGSDATPDIALSAPAVGEYVAGDLPEPFGPGDQITLRVGEGELSLRATCNSMGGEADWSGGVLRVGELASTMMGCPGRGHEQDEFLSAFLDAEPAWSPDGDGFTLSSDEATFEFRPMSEVDPDKPLAGTTWLLESIADGTGPDSSVSSVPAGVKSSLLIRKNGAVQLKPGCNTGRTEVEIADDQLAFGPVALTRMACPGPRGEVEDVVLQALDGPVGYEIKGSTLTLTGQDVQLVYRAAE